MFRKKLFEDVPFYYLKLSMTQSGLHPAYVGFFIKISTLSIRNSTTEFGTLSINADVDQLISTLLDKRIVKAIYLEVKDEK